MSSKALRRQRGVTIVELIIFMVIVGVAAAGIIQVLNLTNRNNTDPIRRKQAMLIAEAYMEEVQQAQMTACDPADANAALATNPVVNPSDAASCASIVEVFGPEAGNTRPFDNVNDYVPLNYTPGTAVRAFAVTNAAGVQVDTDVAGNRLGVNAAGGTLGNVSMQGITTTLTLNTVSVNNPLGPTGNNAANGSNVNISSDSTAAGMNVLQITIRVSYGPGANDVITLDGYRTRYAPRAQ